MTETGQIYVGQSGDIVKRLKEHLASGKLPDGKVVVTIKEVLGGKTVREIAEHRRIQEKTGGIRAAESSKVANKRDPIGWARKYLLKK